MKIYGLRLYPQTVRIVRGDGAPIFIHGRITEEISDFSYIFHHLAPSWTGHVVVSSFGATLGEDPMPGLREQFGLSLIDAELDGQLMLLSGDDLGWWSERYPEQCEFLLIFRGIPTFKLARRAFWDPDFRLSSETWPRQLRAVLHSWDNFFWQYFSVESTDIDVLIRAHAGDSKLKMFLVGVDQEYPDPSNETLQPATLDDIPCDA